MPNLHNSRLVVPAQNDLVTANTPCFSQSIVRINKAPGVPHLLMACFRLAVAQAKALTRQRWEQSGLRCIWAGGRITVEMTYGNFGLTTQSFSLNNYEDDFQTILENMLVSWDEEAFRLAPMVTFVIDLLFHRQVLRAPARGLAHGNDANFRSLRNRNVNIRDAGLYTGRLRPPSNRGAGDNQPRPHGYWGAGATYQEVKKRMFHRRNLNDFYLMTDALMRTPALDMAFCFPMAFVKAQMRWYVFSPPRFSLPGFSIFLAFLFFTPSGIPPMGVCIPRIRKRRCANMCSICRSIRKICG